MDRTTDNIQEVNGKKATSSYGLLKIKYAACKVELAELKGVVQQLRIDLDQKELCNNKNRRTEINSQTTTFYHEKKTNRLILLKV
jgi:hypothetical protein